MLSQADAQLVRQDPQVPGLAMLLNPEAFAETLRRLYPDAGVISAEARYVRYKPHTSCLVGYRVAAEAEPIDVYARAHNQSPNGKVQKATNRRSVPSPLGPGITVLGDDAVVIYPFPNDHELPALQRLATAQRRAEMLRRLLPRHPHLWDAQLESLRYKPERRYVAHLHTSVDRGVALKFYTKEDFRITSDNVKAFVSRGPLRIAQHLRRSQRLQAMAIEWLEGRPLRDALGQSSVSPQSCRTVGAALAALHAQKPKLHISCTAPQYAQLLTDAALAVADIAPRLAPRAQRLSERIGHLLLRRRWRARAIHGDFSAHQVLLQDQVAVIVDFDRAGYGDPRIDLGTFRARLDYDVLSGVLSAATADTSFDALWQEHRLASKEDLTRKLDLFTAASLLRLAVEPFRHRQEDWPEKIEAILAQAQELVEGGRTRD
ncbi:MAG: aminoglycoside phosphotransferase family protein [Phycisphaerales bacterium]